MVLPGRQAATALPEPMAIMEARAAAVPVIVIVVAVAVVPALMLPVPEQAVMVVTAAMEIRLVLPAVQGLVALQVAQAGYREIRAKLARPGL